jgi:chitin disaccharide deacetylase
LSYVIFNADDFGMTDGVSRAIVDCGASGLAMSTTAMTCIDGAAATVAKYAARFGGGIGLHLQLSDSKPASPPDDVPTLVGPDGLMNGRAGAEGWNPVEVAKEWRAQIARLRRWGIEPDHLDCHRHLHNVAPANPHILGVYADLAGELGVPARSGNRSLAQTLRAKGVVCPDIMVHLSQFGADIARLVAALGVLRAQGPAGILVEFACHPGYADADLASAARHVPYVAGTRGGIAHAVRPRSARFGHGPRLGDYSLSRFERDVTPLTRAYSLSTARQRNRRDRRVPPDGMAACADRRRR